MVCKNIESTETDDITIGNEQQQNHKHICYLACCIIPNSAMYFAFSCIWDVVLWDHSWISLCNELQNSKFVRCCYHVPRDIDDARYLGRSRQFSSHSVAVIQSSYLCRGNSFIDKTPSLYWVGPLIKTTSLNSLASKRYNGKLSLPLLTPFHFNSSIDEWLHTLQTAGWNYLKSFPKVQWCSCTVEL